MNILSLPSRQEVLDKLNAWRSSQALRNHTYTVRRLRPFVEGVTYQHNMPYEPTIAFDDFVVQDVLRVDGVLLGMIEYHLTCAPVYHAFEPELLTLDELRFYLPISDIRGEVAWRVMTVLDEELREEECSIAFRDGVWRVIRCFVSCGYTEDAVAAYVRHQAAAGQILLGVCDVPQTQANNQT